MSVFVHVHSVIYLTYCVCARSLVWYINQHSSNVGCLVLAFCVRKSSSELHKLDIKQSNLLNLSIYVSGGFETKREFGSNGE